MAHLTARQRELVELAVAHESRPADAAPATSTLTPVERDVLRLGAHWQLGGVSFANGEIVLLQFALALLGGGAMPDYYLSAMRRYFSPGEIAETVTVVVAAAR